MWNSRPRMPVDDLTGRRGLLARAFELARSGDFSRVPEIRARLIQERYSAVDAHLAGADIKRQLKALCRQAARGFSLGGSESA
jgi:hypothetical protein